ncbi:flavodoxin family protein [Hydrogenophaga sp. BPS33]|uniref:flavodoxin family protein n=1 Tax=Hydrogenophaga sp. BPS33 TaxID=2651974 RepID=UPI00131FD380|nr:flavodoxin [Hydrogenophaga sp. BPS33]QHE86141.1 flavodoxin [Hydrogenophaga sp. BPS33]
MSKNVLVVVYSYTGTSMAVAKLMAIQQNWSLGWIEEKRSRRGAWGSWRCLLDSFLRRHPPIRYHGSSPGHFDAVVLVSPIWALRLAGPMRSFVVAERERLRDVAVVSVMGGQGGPNAVAEVADILGRAPFMSMTVTAREVDDGSCAARLQAFGTAVQGAEDSREVVRPTTLSTEAV